MSQIVSKVQEESLKRDVDFETTKKTIFDPQRAQISQGLKILLNGRF